MKPLSRILIALLVLTLCLPASAVVAQEEDEPVSPTRPLSIYVDYPGMVVGAGETVTVDIDLESGVEQLVELEVEAAPDGWTVDYRGSGKTVTSTYLRAGGSRSLDLRVQIPDDVPSGIYEVVAVARGASQGVARLTLTFAVEEDAPQALSLSASKSSVTGSPDSLFRYDLTVENKSESDLTVELNANTPAGFASRFNVGGETVTSVALGPNEARNLVLIVDPADDAEAGKYPILVQAIGPATTDSVELTAEITGDIELTLSTPDGRLSTEATAGRQSSLKLLVGNTGSAPAEQVRLTSSAPSGWEVTFEPAEIAMLAPGESQEVTMRLQPAEKAIAGDYEVSVTLRAEDASSVSKDFRITVVTSTLWGVVGIALIAVAVVVVGLAVTRFGRR